MITQKSNAASEASQQRIEESAAMANDMLRNTSRQESQRTLPTAMIINFQPHPKIQLPTVNDAIEMLDRLGKRLEKKTVRSVQQLPKIGIGKEFAPQPSHKGRNLTISLRFPKEFCRSARNRI
jgi:hypothetical protein